MRTRSLLTAALLTGCATPLPHPTPTAAPPNEVVAYQRAFATRFQQLKREDRNACLNEEGGCGQRAFSPPPCPGELAVMSKSGLPQGFEGSAGAPIALRGKLVSDTSCTQLYCEDACCNGCGGQLALELPDGQRVELEPSPAHADAFTCMGDDSMTCCGYKPDGRIVVASGQLTSRDGGLKPQPRVLAATLCTP
jgi:hypothetical protein